MKRSCRLSACALAALAAVAVDRAAAQHLDIFLARPATGTTTVLGGADVDAADYDDVTRIFEVELGAVAGEFLAVEPGVNHPNVNDPGLSAYPVSASPLMPGDVVSLRPRSFAVAGVVDDLFYWNGLGDPTFAPAAANFRLDEADPLGGSVGVGGAFDDHPFVVVDSDALPGIYLASVVGQVAGLDPSRPAFLVMGTKNLITASFLGVSQAEFELLSDDELDEALEEVIAAGATFVETQVIPEPSPAALAGGAMAGSAAAARRRRMKGRLP